MENERNRIHLEDRKSEFSLNIEPRFRNTNSKLIMTEEVYKN